MMYEIKDKVFLVTGAAAGIGAGAVRAFLDEGAKHVAILDVDVSSGKALEEELQSKYGPDSAKFHKCDVTSNDLQVAYDNVMKEFEYIDVVVNNAGILNDSPNVFEKQVAVNVTALMTSSLKAYNLMRKDHGGKGGAIVNISSIAGISQCAALPVYTATKSAVLQFSNCLGMDLHYTRSGVRVMSVCFGCTQTTLFSETKLGGIDQETDKILLVAFKTQLPWQMPASAVSGLLEAYKNGKSASTWLVTSGRPARDISENVKKAYEIMSQGIYEPTVN